MPKRTNTAVWMEKYNRWQINVQKDGKRKTFTSSKHGRTGQREANAKADQWLDEGIVAGAKVSKLWEQYVHHISEKSGTSSWKKAEEIGRAYILPYIGNKKIGSVTEGQLQDIIDRAYRTGAYANRRLKEGETLSRKTLNNILAQIRAFFKYCRVNLRCTTLNPESLQIPNSARYKGKSILQPEHLSILFSETMTTFYGKSVQDPFIYAYRFIVATGLRPGEAVALTCGDIHGDEVRMQRSVNIYGEQTQGKNENAVRGFVMTSLAKEAYLAQLELLRERGVKITPQTPLLGIEKEQDLYRNWKRYCKANNIPEISVYEMRHTFVSVSKQLPEGLVKSLVGHSRNMDTFGIYGHQIRGEAKETADLLDKAFGKVLEKENTSKK